MSDELRALREEASVLQKEGKLPAALERWQQLSAKSPNDLVARHRVADLLAKLGRRDEAITGFEEVARRYAEQGQFFKASAVCRVVLGLDPKHQRIQQLIAQLYSESQTPAPEPAASKVPAVPPLVSIEPGTLVPVARLQVDVPPPRLPSIPLFSTLKSDEMQEVLRTSMEVRAYDAQELIVREGDTGTSMFALVEGKASIYRGWGTPEARKVAVVASGDIFGEVAMVSGAPRLATVAADEAAVVLEFRREAIMQVISRYSRVAEMLERFYRERLLANALRASPLLRSMSDEHKRALAAAFQPCTFDAAQTIITEGQPAELVYVLLRGLCSVSHHSGHRYPDLREGDLFGEVSALTGGAATATVVAQGTAVALRLKADQFRALVLKDGAASLAVKALVKTRLERTEQFDQAHGDDVLEGELLDDGRA